MEMRSGTMNSPKSSSSACAGWPVIFDAVEMSAKISLSS
jgi:hypothetical protein